MTRVLTKRGAKHTYKTIDVSISNTTVMQEMELWSYPSWCTKSNICTKGGQKVDVVMLDIT